MKTMFFYEQLDFNIPVGDHIWLMLLFSIKHKIITCWITKNKHLSFPLYLLLNAFEFMIVVTEYNGK